MGKIDNSSLTFLDPFARVGQIDRLHAVKPTPPLKHAYWIDEFPLGIGLDSSTNTVYVSLYKGLINQKFYPLTNPDFTALTDVSINSDGLIYITDRYGLYTYSVDPETFSFRFHTFIPSTNLRYVESSEKGVAIATPYALYFYSNYSQETPLEEPLFILTGFDHFRTLTAPTSQIPLLFTESLDHGEIVDISLTEAHILIALKHSILVVDYSGNVIRDIPIKRGTVSALAGTLSGDFFILSRSPSSLIKYTPTGVKLGSEPINQAMTDITMYRSFGYLGATTGHEGYYFAMTTDLQDVKLRHRSSSVLTSNDTIPSDNVLQFTLTMPSYVTLTLDTGSRSTIVTQNALMYSGAHEISISGSIIKATLSMPTPSTMTLRAKAAFSMENEHIVSKNYADF